MQTQTHDAAACNIVPEQQPEKPFQPHRDRELAVILATKAGCQSVGQILRTKILVQRSPDPVDWKALDVEAKGILPERRAQRQDSATDQLATVQQIMARLGYSGVATKIAELIEEQNHVP